MKGITFFSGGGLADIGYEEAGIEHVLCVDFNEDAVASAKAAGFPSVCCGVEDTATWLPLVADEPGPFFVHASPPCQPYSTAGSRKAQHDERDGFPMLWTARDALGGRVRWLVIEQVPGLLQHNGACKDRCTGRCPRSYFDNEVLTELRRRFDWVDYRVLNSSSFGVPQHRRRVVVVAGPGPIVWPEPTHGDPATLNQGSLFGPRLKPWVSCGEALGLSGALPPPNNRGALSQSVRPLDPAQPADAIQAGTPTSNRAPFVRILGGGTNPRAPGEGDKRTLRDITDEPSTTIAAQSGGGAGNAGPFDEGPALGVEWTLDASRNTEANPHQERPSPVSEPSPSVGGKGNLYLNPPSGYQTHWVEDPKHPTMRLSEPASALRSGGDGHSAPPAWVETRAATEPQRLEQPAPTVTTTEAKGTRGDNMGKKMASGATRGGVDRASDALWLATGRRRLTVEECLMLMGVRPDYPLQGTKTARYRIVGNGCTPAVFAVVGRAVLEADA